MPWVCGFVRLAHAGAVAGVAVSMSRQAVKSASLRPSAAESWIFVFFILLCLSFVSVICSWFSSLNATGLLRHTEGKVTEKIIVPRRCHDGIGKGPPLVKKRPHSRKTGTEAVPPSHRALPGPARDGRFGGAVAQQLIRGFTARAGRGRTGMVTRPNWCRSRSKATPASSR